MKSLQPVKNTTFNLGNLPRGACPCMLMWPTLERIIGANAFEMYATDVTLSAEAALKEVLIHYVVENDNDALSLA